MSAGEALTVGEDISIPEAMAMLADAQDGKCVACDQNLSGEVLLGATCGGTAVLHTSCCHPDFQIEELPAMRAAGYTANWSVQ